MFLISSFILVLLSITLSFSFVQTALANAVTNRVNGTYGTSIEIDKLDLSSIRNVELRSVIIRDHHNDTLIYADNIITSLLNYRSLFKSDLKFGDISLREGKLKMTTYEGDSLNNLTLFVRKFDTGKEKKNTFKMQSSLIEVENVDFVLYNKNKRDSPIVSYVNISGEFHDFDILGSDVSSRIRNLSSLENHDVLITDFDTDFKYTNQQMDFLNTELRTKNSEIKADVVFKYEKKDLLDFVNKVEIDADFKEAHVVLADLQKLYGEFGRNDEIHFSGKAKGTINDFVIRDIKLRSDRNSSLRGTLYLKQVLNKEDFSLYGDIDEISSNYDHLVNLLPDLLGTKVPKALEKIGYFSSRGKIAVSRSDLDIQLKTISQMGMSDIDMALKDIDKGDKASYKGSVELIDFKLGKFVKDSLIGDFSLRGEVEGQGFSIDSINIRVKGNISKHQYKGYTYSNIDINGELRDKRFDGYLAVDDPNIQLTFKGLAELDDDYQFNFNADVDHADFKRLNLFTRDDMSILRGGIEMNLHGSNFDNIQGKISFTDASYTNENDAYYFKDFTITSEIDEKERLIEVNSTDIFNGYVKGNFRFNQIKKLARNSLGSLFVNYKKEKVVSGQYLDFNFNIHSKIVDVFFPEWQLLPNSVIRGTINADEDIFKLTIRSPGIEAFDFSVEDVSLQVDNQNPLYNTLLSVSEFDSKYYNLSDITLVNVMLKDTLFLRADLIGGKEKKERYNFSLYHTINEKGQLVAGIKRSELYFKGNSWLINPENNLQNKVVFDKKLTTFAFDNFNMIHDNQQIHLAGLINGPNDKNIDLRLKNVDLYDITPSIDSVKIDGRINGHLNLRNIQGKTLPFADITINYFSINDDYYGDLNIRGGADESIRNYAFGANLLNGGLQTFRAQGAIDFSSVDPTILASARFDKFRINSFSPLGKNVISKIRGFASGDVSFTGRLVNPYINGQIELDQAGLELPYLNVNYDFEGITTVDLYEHTFEFKPVQLVDTAKNTRGVITGTIEHKSFKQWMLDMRLTTDNLLVLNRNDYEGALYYGTGYMGGTTTLQGYTDNLVINVEGRTNPGTEFIVPLGNVSTINRSKLIHFESFEETEDGVTTIRPAFKKLKGLTLNFNLQVTRDAIAQIVIDRATGSVLRGSGDGDIRLNIDTNGKFEMYGDLVVDHGEYQFKNIVNKNFEVLKGGTIIWDGDPYNARIDITAVNYTKANPSVLLDGISSSRKIDVELYTYMSGNLTAPELDFDVKIPNADSMVASELKFKLRSEDDKLTQFFSLLATGSFASTDNNKTNFNSNAAITGTLAQKASQLLSNMLESDNENFEVGVTYDIGTDNRVQDVTTDDQLGVEVSGRIADKVMVSGKVGVPVGSNTNSNVIGEVEVKVPLNENETLQAKVYNRQNEVQFDVVEGEGYTQGVGISYRFDFNNGREFLEKLGLKKTAAEKKMTKEQLDSLKVDKKERKKEEKKENPE